MICLKFNWICNSIPQLLFIHRNPLVWILWWNYSWSRPRYHPLRAHLLVLYRNPVFPIDNIFEKSLVLALVFGWKWLLIALLPNTWRHQWWSRLYSEVLRLHEISFSIILVLREILHLLRENHCVRFWREYRRSNWYIEITYIINFHFWFVFRNGAFIDLDVHGSLSWLGFEVAHLWSLFLFFNLI